MFLAGSPWGPKGTAATARGTPRFPRGLSGARHISGPTCHRVQTALDQCDPCRNGRGANAAGVRPSARRWASPGALIQVTSRRDGPRGELDYGGDMWRWLLTGPRFWISMPSVDCIRYAILESVVPRIAYRWRRCSRTPTDPNTSARHPRRAQPDTPPGPRRVPGREREEESVMAQGTTDTTRCIDRLGINVDNVRLEQVAAHSADGYARMEAKYGSDRGRIGNTLGDVPSDQFAKMLGGYGEEVRDPKDIAPALRRARESGLPSLINVWVDPGVYAPGTMNQAMYK